jgi:glycosyltransferase involved in cell wall biosynthesis
MDNGPTVTVVISAKNEELDIAEAVRGAKPHCDEVLVMDGHSTDRTREVAKAEGARVELDPGRGKGSAIRASFELARGDIVVLMDADGSHDPADIPKLWKPVAAGEVDLCVGSRYLGGSEELSINFGQLIRSIGNISMNIAINKRFTVYLSDTLNGFRAIRRDVARKLRLIENKHTIEQEMVIRALREGCKVKNVPAHEYARKHGQSHIRIWREWPHFLWCMFKNLYL